MCQLMGAGKPQPSGGGILSTKRVVDQDGPAFDLYDGVAGDVVIVNNSTAVIKNGLAQNAAVLPQTLKFQCEALCFDDILDGDHCGNAIIERRIIGGDDFAGDPLQNLFPVVWCSHAVVSLSSPDDLMRRLIRSIKSCHS